MQVDRVAGGARRRRATGATLAPAVALAVSPATPVPSRVLEHGAAKTYRTFPVEGFAKGGGEWKIDWERAHADAQATLDAIDWSKRDIVIWVPGTNNRGPRPKFADAVREAYRGEGTNLVALEYPATWQLRESLPTGIATMRLVLEGIRARGGDHRVLLGGESQGAWVIGAVMADAEASSVVDRAVLLGHPWLAAHQYDRGQDSRVRVINNAGDQVAASVKGDPTVALDAMIAVRTLNVSKFGDVVKALATNPGHGVTMLSNMVRSMPGFNKLLKHPHDYDGEMSRAVEYLRHGSLPASNAFAAIAHLAPVAAELTDPAHDEDAHRRLARGAAIAAYSQFAAVA